VLIYTARQKFNEMASKATYIRYKTNKIGTAVYKRRTAWGSVDQYELFVNHWSIKDGNKFHKDFDIFNSFEDALADKDPWQYCNGDDYGVGFPRDCAAHRHTIYRWFAFPKNSSTVPEYVDFIHRFDTNYLHSKNKCYNKATFEIFGEFAEEPVYEVEQPEPVEEPSADSEKDGAVYIGCFKDSQSSRDLKHRKGAFAIGDREHCFKACQDAGYQYAGLQSKGECFCGSDYGKHGKGKECDVRCAAGSKDFGFLSNCVYDVNYFVYKETTVVTETEHNWQSQWSLQAQYTGCAGAGELYSLYYDHQNSSWLPEMFEAKDDAAWLLRLYEERQISSFQFHWLSELFEKKVKQDCGDEANIWWHDVFTNGFHEDHVPDFIKEHTKESERRMAAVTDGQGSLII